MKEEWKDKLRARLTDYEAAVPEGLWSGIEASLDASKTGTGANKAQDAGGKRERKRMRIVILRALAAAACIACCVGIFLHGGEDAPLSTAPQAKQARNICRQATAGKQVDNNATAVAGGGNLLAMASGTVVSNGSANDEDVSSEQTAGAISPTNDILAGTRTNENQPSSKSESQENSSGSNATAMESVVINRSRQHEQGNAHGSTTKASRPQTASRQTADDGRITASLFAANSMSGTNAQNGGMYLVSSSDALLSSMPDQGHESETRDYYLGRGNGETTKHHRPVRYGLAVRYALTDRLGIETGLTYSRLSSDISCSIDESRHDTEQVLHFVGIPLNIDYSLWQNRTVRLYLSAGAMVEKSVRGKATTTYLINDAQMSASSADVRMKELQWSANAAAGVQLNVTNNIGLYAEPGASYYFDNGSVVRTAYSEKPLNFNLKLGLRYSFR